MSILTTIGRWIATRLGRQGSTLARTRNTLTRRGILSPQDITNSQIIERWGAGRSQQGLRGLDPGEVIPRGLITEGRLGRPRRYLFKGEVTFFDELSGQIRQKNVSIYDDHISTVDNILLELQTQNAESQYLDKQKVVGFQLDEVIHQQGFPF